MDTWAGAEGFCNPKSALGLPPQQEEEKPDNPHVDGKHNHPDHMEMPDDLVNLQRNERARHDDGEIFRPALLEEQPHAFGEEEHGVEGGQAAGHLDPLVRDEVELFEKTAD